MQLVEVRREGERSGKRGGGEEEEEIVWNLQCFRRFLTRCVQDGASSWVSNWGGCVKEVENSGRFCPPILNLGMIYWPSKSRWCWALGTDY